MISVYGASETAFTSNGLVVLSDCISCIVTEELNGLYECVIEHPLDSRGKWQYLLEDNILKVDGQLFRGYHKTKTLTSVVFHARHIFYDLAQNLLEDVRPTDLSGTGALDWILNRTQYAHPFTSIGDVGGTNTKYFIRKNPVEAIMGNEGIISIWGGELVRENFLIKLLGARGLDRGVLVAYGKNIQGIEEDLDTSGICTRLMPIGKDGLLLAEKYIDSPCILNYPYPKIKVVEFSDAETEGSLQSAGEAHMVNAKIDIPQFNYKIDFLELSKTEEYKDYAVLERVYMGDTVSIRHSRLNIDLKAKVIKITKNALTDRIEKVELGSFKPNLATGISNAIQEVKQEIVDVKSAYQLAIDNATALITGSQGGNVVIRQDETGKPIEILIMDTTDVLTAEQVWRWNLGGFGHSSTGVNGPFDTAITQDGHIVASFITALVINGEQIIAGIIQSKTGKWVLNLDGETFNLGDKLVFDGTNLTFGAGVTLSWNAITSQPDIPTQYTDTEALAAWVASGYKTWIDANGVYTGTVIASKIIAGIITGMLIKAGKIVGTDDDAVLLFGEYGGNVNTHRDSTTGRKVIRLVPSSGVSGYVFIEDSGLVDFYKSDDTGISFASISPTSGIQTTKGFSGLGKVPAATWTGTIALDSSVTITHNLGYKPIVDISGTIGNIVITHVHLDDNRTQIQIYSLGGNTFAGTVNFY